MEIRITTDTGDLYSCYQSDDTLTEHEIRTLALGLASRAWRAIQEREDKRLCNFPDYESDRDEPGDRIPDDEED